MFPLTRNPQPLPTNPNTPTPLPNRHHKPHLITDLNPTEEINTISSVTKNNNMWEMCPCWGYVQRTECQRYGTWWPHCVAHFHMSTCCMYRCLWSVHLTVICLFEYVQEVSSQGETQWKATSKAFLRRFSGLIENHHSCIPALKVTGSAVAVVYCALCLVLNSISKSHKSPNKPTLTTT